MWKPERVRAFQRKAQLVVTEVAWVVGKRKKGGWSQKRGWRVAAAGFVKGGCTKRRCENRDGRRQACGRRCGGRQGMHQCGVFEQPIAAPRTPKARLQRRPRQRGAPPWPGSSPSAADPRLLISVAPALKQGCSSFHANHDLAQPIARQSVQPTMSLQAHNSICNAHGRAHHSAPTTAPGLLAPQRRRREPMTARPRRRACPPPPCPAALARAGLATDPPAHRETPRRLCWEEAPPVAAQQYEHGDYLPAWVPDEQPRPCACYGVMAASRSRPPIQISSVITGGSARLNAAALGRLRRSHGGRGVWTAASPRWCARLNDEQATVPTSFPVAAGVLFLPGSPHLPVP